MPLKEALHGESGFEKLSSNYVKSDVPRVITRDITRDLGQGRLGKDDIF